MWNIPTAKRLAKVPFLNETEMVPIREKEIHLHFFIGGSDWYVVEYDPKTRRFFGYVILNDDKEMSEFGYFSFDELIEIKISGLLEIACEKAKFWKPTKIKDIPNLNHVR